MKRALRILLVVLVVALPLLLLRNESTRAVLVSLMEYMRSAGPKGVLAFLAAELVAAVLLFPIWLMSGVAGYVYGFPNGVLFAAPGVSIAASAAFLLARGVFAFWRPKGMGATKTWRAIEKASQRQGFKIVFLLRATPVMPQNFLSVLFASTPITLREFALGTFLGLLPVTFFHVYVGSLVSSAAALAAGETDVPGPMRWIAPAAAVGISVIAIYVTSRIARRSLNEALAEVERQDAAGVEPDEPVQPVQTEGEET